MLFEPSLYAFAALLYGAQTRDALRHCHPCQAYAGLACVHLLMAVKKVWVVL